MESEKQNIDQTKALNTLVQYIVRANSKGCYTLEQAELINKAIKVFTGTTPPSQNENSNKLDTILEDTDNNDSIII